jgi:FlaA1/EpsC-like NDP-sugar epimerase
MVMDLVLFGIAIYQAFWLRFETVLPIAEIPKYASSIGLLIASKHLIFRARGMYRPILCYTGVEFLSIALESVLYSLGILVIFAYLQGFYPFPRAVSIADALLTLLWVVSARLFLRWLVRGLKKGQNQTPERAIVYGAGAAGSQLALALANDRTYRAIAFVDDNPELQHQVVVQGLRVYSPEELPQLWSQKLFDSVILAMPSVARVRKRRIINRLRSYSIPVKTIPTLGELLSGKVSIAQFRELDIAELLGRDEVKSDLKLLRRGITGKSVLVTGAGGSIGSELCRQIVQQQPKLLVLYELSEYTLYQIDLELAETYPHLPRVACLGNALDREHFRRVLKQYEVDTIYHAAAYKHVPLVEINPFQGVYNNVFSTLVTAQCAIACKVKNFVLISTDKAVRPTSVMGASKRVAELAIQALQARSTDTCFAIVRFGNVLGSSGSVVPRFRQQIAAGKSITITHPEIARYFMSIPEAARLVIQAGAMAKGGEVFLLDMGKPVRIYDLALQMIHLSGLVLGRDIEIKFTGLRPGEKLYEELLIAGDNVQPTEHPQIYCAREAFWPWDILHSGLDTLSKIIQLSDRDQLIAELRALVPEYQPQPGGKDPQFRSNPSTVERYQPSLSSQTRGTRSLSGYLSITAHPPTPARGSGNQTPERRDDN